jgi:hypothetical protein
MAGLDLFACCGAVSRFLKEEIQMVRVPTNSVDAAARLIVHPPEIEFLGHGSNVLHVSYLEKRGIELEFARRRYSIIEKSGR